MARSVSASSKQRKTGKANPKRGHTTYIILGVLYLGIVGEVGYFHGIADAVFEAVTLGILIAVVGGCFWILFRFRKRSVSKLHKEIPIPKGSLVHIVCSHRLGKGRTEHGLLCVFGDRVEFWKDAEAPTLVVPKRAVESFVVVGASSASIEVELTANDETTDRFLLPPSMREEFERNVRQHGMQRKDRAVTRAKKEREAKAKPKSNAQAKWKSK